MEHFFTPTIRRLSIEHPEVKLAVSIEAFINYSWDWSDLREFATAGDEGERRSILWIAEDTFLCVEGENTLVLYDLLEEYAIQRATFTAANGDTHELALATDRASSPSLSAGASSVFWHALTTSNCVKLRLKHWSSWFGGLCSGPALSQFFEASPSLELLEFTDFDFDEAHCRAVATLERTGLEVTFEGVLRPGCRCYSRGHFHQVASAQPSRNQT
jgi:hypothetical protein